MLKNIRLIWIMIYFECLIIIFHHCYKSIILNFPKIGDYLKILTDDEVKGFVAINLTE